MSVAREHLASLAALKWIDRYLALLAEALGSAIVNARQWLMVMADG
jgi:hypothetical protein